MTPNINTLTASILIKHLVFLYGSILNVIYGVFPYSLAFLALSVLILLRRNKYFVFLLPFIIYPFQFLIRAQSPDNITLILLPELTICLAITSYFLIRDIRFSSLNFTYTLILVVYISLSITIYFSHLYDIAYFPILLRQNILPVVFLVIFINISSFRDMASFSLKLCFLSYSIISILIIFNLTNILTINQSTEGFYRFVDHSGEWLDPAARQRVLFDFIGLPRINLFLGGAIGSAAAILVALGLMPFLKRSEFSKFTYKIAGLPLVLLGFLSLSFSVIVPIILFIIMCLSRKTAFIFLPVLTAAIFYLIQLDYLDNRSITDYFLESIASHFLSYLESISVMSLLFGIGPRIIASGYYFVPDNFLVDIGLLRVFLETGIINFSLFIFGLLVVLKKSFVVLTSASEGSVHYAVFLLLTLLALVHANMTAFSPFFPIYVAVVAVIFDNSRRVTLVKAKKRVQLSRTAF